jgi:hypothetical protein
VGRRYSWTATEFTCAVQISLATDIINLRADASLFDHLKR